MKKVFILLFPLLLTACGRYGADYQPKFATMPTNAAAYEADRLACIAATDAKTKAQRDDYYDRTMSGKLTLGEKSSGMVPPIIQLGSAAFSDEQDNTPMGITDRCLSAKGYDVVKVEHCC